MWSVLFSTVDYLEVPLDPYRPVRFQPQRGINQVPNRPKGASDPKRDRWRGAQRFMDVAEIVVGDVQAGGPLEARMCLQPEPSLTGPAGGSGWTLQFHQRAAVHEGSTSAGSGAGQGSQRATPRGFGRPGRYIRGPDWKECVLSQLGRSLREDTQSSLRALQAAQNSGKAGSAMGTRTAQA